MLWCQAEMAFFSRGYHRTGALPWRHPTIFFLPFALTPSILLWRARENNGQKWILTVAYVHQPEKLEVDVELPKI
jgi:hypothetical protein